MFELNLEKDGLEKLLQTMNLAVACAIPLYFAADLALLNSKSVFIPTWLMSDNFLVNCASALCVMVGVALNLIPVLFTIYSVVTYLNVIQIFLDLLKLVIITRAPAR